MSEQTITKSNKIPDPPAENLCQEAVDYWNTVLTNWEPEPHEMQILEVACFSLSRYYEAKRLLDKEGLTIVRGQMLRKHPALEIAKVERAAFFQAVKLLGLQEPETKKSVGRPPDSSQ